MPGKSPWRTVAGATAVVLLAAGCSSGDSDDTETPDNTVVIGIAEPQNLVPADTTGPDGSQVLSSLFYPLVTFDENRQPVEAAARSISSSDNRVWTVRLKPGFTFGNGEPVTADSYLDAWNFGAYGPNAQRGAYLFERIDGFADLQSRDPDGDGPQQAPEPAARTLSGLEKVDDTTFRVTLSAPFSGWKSVLHHTAFYPLPKAAFSAPGVLAPGFENAPIGNGPFRMKGTWEHGAQIRVEKVANFPGRVPKVDAITWKIYPDPSTEYADLVSGDVDVQTQIPLDRLASAPGDLDDRFRKSLNSVFQFVGFPAYRKEFAKPEVRRAISMAIDRRAMTDQIFLGSQTPATSFVSPVVAGYRPDSCGQFCVHDAAKARAMYTAAGGPSSLRITYNTDAGHKPWVDAMCAQLTASLGVACTGVAEPGLTDVLAEVDARRPVGLIRLSWTMDYPLMENYLSSLYATNGPANYYGYTDTTVDRLLRQGSEARTPQAAVAKWQQAEDVVARDMPVIPLRFGQNVYGWSERVTDVDVDPFQNVDVYRIAVAP